MQQQQPRDIFTLGYFGLLKLLRKFMQPGKRERERKKVSASLYRWRYEISWHTKRGILPGIDTFSLALCTQSLAVSLDKRYFPAMTGSINTESRFIESEFFSPFPILVKKKLPVFPTTNTHTCRCEVDVGNGREKIYSR